MAILKVTAIIPTLNPNDHIFTVVQLLCAKGFSEIIIVNDGSDDCCLPIFQELEKNPCCTVLTHQHNEGKGQALKTAFRWYLTQPIEQKLGVITLDDDGQHDMESIANCARALENDVESLILGVRDFDSANVPLKSRCGNKVTSAVFALSCGLRISDTQTGLRAIPNRWLPILTEIPGNRFEYETAMLLAAKRNGIPILEIPIRTIYVAGNQSTHFRPLVDSLRIYKQLMRFLLSSLLSFVVDISIFWLICFFLPGSTATRVFWGTFVSRSISSVANFLTNRCLVFRQNDILIHSAGRYYLLCGVQALASFLLVGGLGMLSSGRWLVPLKMLVDGVLFLLSFQIQKRWVFRPIAREVQNV